MEKTASQHLQTIISFVIIVFIWMWPVAKFSGMPGPILYTRYFPFFQGLGRATWRHLIGEVNMFVQHRPHNTVQLTYIFRRLASQKTKGLGVEWDLEL